MFFVVHDDRCVGQIGPDDARCADRIRRNGLVTEVQAEPIAEGLANYPTQYDGCGEEFEVAVRSAATGIAQDARAGAALAVEMAGVKGKRRRSAGNESRDDKALAEQLVAQRDGGLHRRLEGCLTVGRIVLMKMAVVGVQPAGTDVRQSRELAIKSGCLRARSDTTPPHADIEVEQQIDAASRVATGL